MNVGSEANKSVELIASNLSVQQKLSMTVFSITDYKLINVTGKGIQMRVRFKRKIMSELMTTYFPSILLMMITFATTFFKPFFFEAALSVNLTTMLVMTTIFISKMESLPPTSATKMIDYWLILCQLVPFIQVVLLTAMEYIRVEDSIAEKEDDEHKEDCTAIDGHQDNCIDLETIGTEQKEAWSIQQPNRSKPNLLHKLVLIGKSTVDHLLSLYLVPFPTLQYPFWGYSHFSYEVLRIPLPSVTQC